MNMNNIGVFEIQDVMNHRDAIIIDNIIWLDILDNVDDAEVGCVGTHQNNRSDHVAGGD